MAISDCGACDKLRNCGASLNERGFYGIAARLLCDIAEALSSDGGTEQVVPLFDSMDYDDLTDSYQVILTDGHAKLEIVVDNQTDEEIFVSLDGVSDHERIGPNSVAKMTYGAYKRHHMGNVYIKRGASIPTEGAVYVSARY